VTASRASLKVSADGARLRLLITAFSFVVFAVFAAIFALILTHEHRSTLKQAGQLNENLVRTLEQHAARSLDGVDLVLKVVVELLRAPSAWGLATEAMQGQLKHWIETTPEIRFIAVFGPDGKPHFSSVSALPPDVNYGYRDYFKVHVKEDTAGRLFVGEPVRQHGDGELMLPLSRGIHGPDGKFIGVVMAGVEPKYFEKFFSSIDFGNDAVISLRSIGSQIVARRPPAAEPDRRSGPADSVFALIGKGQYNGTLTGVTDSDGALRTVSYRVVQGYPLVIEAALAERNVLAGWRLHAWRYSTALGATALLIGFFNLLLLRQIHARSRDRQALDEIERDYRSIFNNAIDGIYRSSVEGRQLRANPALVALNGYGSEEEMLPAVRDIGTEWYVEPGRREEFMRCLNETGFVSNFVSEVYRHKTRERIWVSESARLVRDKDGKPLFYEGIVRDITELRRAEEAMMAAANQAEAANRAKSDFLANTSHELRTPLNAIIGFSEILREQMFGKIGNSVYVDYARHICDSGRHLLGLINDLLDLSKAEAGRMEIQEDVVDVRDVVDQCVATLKPQADRAGITVSVGTDGHLPALSADESKLRQVLINLLSNAVKFTPAGGSVAIDAHMADDGSFALLVADTGIGMSADQIPLALEPFRQIDSALSRRHGGTGLGLPLTRRLVELHGGSLEIASTLNVGTRVTVSLPSERVVAMANPVAALAN
jgi:PAS domain S-box-containing protein